MHGTEGQQDCALHSQEEDIPSIYHPDILKCESESWFLKKHALLRPLFQYAAFCPDPHFMRLVSTV
eukprot:scaffold588078_cov51-Prasinocladus_malaysianus.AAC.1